MLKIRKEQMEIFEQAAIRNFEDEMVQHLKKFSPRHCDVIGEDNVREVIRLGIERGKKYNLTNRGPVRFYIELMFMFGSDFDTDPQLPWAGKILNDPMEVDQKERADQLYEKMTNYLDNVAGPVNAYTLDALRKIRRAASEDVKFSGEAFESGMLSQMKRIYPQKCNYVGDAPLRMLIQRGVELAATYSVTITRGVALFVVLMFALGHGFSDDPLFPWASRTLKDEQITDPLIRAKRLEAKALTYLSHVLKYLEQ